MPEITDRPEQPYVAAKATVTMSTIASLADRLPELIGKLAAEGTPIAGAPFFRYTGIGPGDALEMEAGVPLAAPVDLGDPWASGLLPAGRYVVETHHGHPAGLAEATAAVLDWGTGRGLKWDMTETGGGERWGCRLEVLKTNPAEQPDWNLWETDLVLRLER
ncbi:GyrI-like domain-containing protein [Amycolatopsis sp. H20-H5]|uniref:GyrI-like domain-containing protein n=1 Tax=Amycolatopsis sp. H20-H5 TaxID=3046309 RepID=UPI002DBDD504|nr:GyrI-like domain-containing protein [Amycolatopsis sp. H20-H5]MEC3976794.1 GyrI-like domain-containing protein [Amycolatopsis sp. H20-H5]